MGAGCPSQVFSQLTPLCSKMKKLRLREPAHDSAQEWWGRDWLPGPPDVLVTLGPSTLWVQVL